jgi:AcrR family transcriptional regulator
MIKRRKRPSRKSVGAVRSSATERAILKAAAQVLREDGYDNFSIEAVAKRARAGKPTIYRWWGNKTNLICDVYTQIKPATIEVREPGSVREEIAEYYDQVWKIWSSRTAATVSRRLIADAQIDRNFLLVYRDSYLAKRHEPLVSSLKRGIERGELPGDVDIDLVVDLFSGFHMRRLMMEQPVDPRLTRQVVDVILEGLRAGGRTR